MPPANTTPHNPVVPSWELGAQVKLLYFGRAKIPAGATGLIGAYAVFAAFLAWDFLVPRLRLARARRNIVLRAKREAARKNGNPA